MYKICHFIGILYVTITMIIYMCLLQLPLFMTLISYPTYENEQNNYNCQQNHCHYHNNGYCEFAVTSLEREREREREREIGKSTILHLLYNEQLLLTVTCPSQLLLLLFPHVFQYYLYKYVSNIAASWIDLPMFSPCSTIIPCMLVIIS